MGIRVRPFYRALVAACLTEVSYVQGAETESDSVEEIIVSGSRIPRQDFESASPIVTVPGEAFLQSGSASVETVLRRLPQFVPDNGAFPTPVPGDPGGRATLQLRGLGAHSTLVLLDGKRLVPSFGDGAVDVNIIPPELVERVEIITGGASAVYGSDAVAGVVNFKLRERYDGVELSGSWGRTDQQDGDEQQAGITAGTAFADGRGHAIGYVGYANRDAITLAERNYSAYALGYVGPGNGVTGRERSFALSGSSVVAEAQFDHMADAATFDSVFAGYGFAPGSVPYQWGVATNDDGSVFTTGDGAPAALQLSRSTRSGVLQRRVLYVQLQPVQLSAVAARTRDRVRTGKLRVQPLDGTVCAGVVHGLLR